MTQFETVIIMTNSAITTFSLTLKIRFVFSHPTLLIENVLKSEGIETNEGVFEFIKKECQKSIIDTEFLALNPITVISVLETTNNGLKLGNLGMNTNLNEIFS